MIDLHVHSTFSDGSLTPAELADTAERDGLSALALTDHDSTSGLAPFLAACEGRRLRGIPGVEISADFRPGTMHILGYLIDPADPALEASLSRIRDGRKVRNRRILEKLNELGMNITWDDVRSKAGQEVVGRPHFALALQEAGFVKSPKQAFDLYLAKGKPAYADRFRLSPAESIGLIRGAGGVAVLGHPFTLELGRKGLRKLTGELVGFGLAGMEVYYSEHNSRQVRQYLALAEEFGLVVTGGSDFHGALNPDIKLGRGFGSLKVPDELLDGLYRAAGRRLGP